MAKTKPAPPQKGKRPFLKIVGCAALSLASNICAPLFLPAVGIGLALIALVCWVLSLYQAEQWIKSRVLNAPFTHAVVVVILVGLGTFTGKQALKSYQREWGSQSTPTTQSPCPSGSATATGNGNVVVSGCGNDVGTAQKRERDK